MSDPGDQREAHVNRVVLALPWYDGPDKDTYQLHFEIMHYFGRLRERSLWLSHGYDVPAGMPPLDPMQADGDNTEITAEDGVFEFFLADESGLSLPGLARERLVETALANGMEWIFFFDDDMQMPWSAFLRLWRHKKPVCAALAFTAREPVMPVIYRIVEGKDENGPVFRSETVFDYPRDRLITSEDVGGSLAFGAGVMLCHADVFRQIPRPWFHSTGCGEDWYFCVRCHMYGIPRYVDTSIKTNHKAHAPRWIGENEYDRSRRDNADTYRVMIEKGE